MYPQCRLIFSFEAVWIWFRHADAEYGMPDGRKLTAKVNGSTANRAMACIPISGRCTYSGQPAKRAQQTACALNRQFETRGEVGTGASVESVLEITDWPKTVGAVVVVGHQPTLGRIAATLLSGTEENWIVKKGSVWWFSSRVREGRLEIILRVVMSPEFLKPEKSIEF